MIGRFCGKRDRYRSGHIRFLAGAFVGRFSLRSAPATPQGLEQIDARR